MRPSELLRKAKPLLWDGMEKSFNLSSHICNAVYTAARKHGGQPACNKIMERIAERLAPYSTLSIWLECQDIPRADLTYERVQAHRLAWMDILINEFEEEGK